MNISSFSRMKCFRKNGRIAIVLKLRLPRAEDTSGNHSAFDGFYSRLAEKYLSVADALPFCTEAGTRPTTLTVDYAIESVEHIKKRGKGINKRKSIIVVRRIESVNNNEKKRTRQYCDFYDEDGGVFIK